MGDFFPEIATNSINSGGNKKIFPHKKGMGSGKRRGRPQKLYWIPPAYAMDEVFGKGDNTFVAFPARALESDLTYEAYVWKVPLILAGGRLTKRQSDMAAVMNISMSTQKGYAQRSGTRSSVYREKIRLSAQQIAALPKDPATLRQVLKHRGTRIFRVYDEHGRHAPANRQDILERGLEGQLYADVRVGTTYQDETLDAWVVRDRQHELGLRGM